MRLALLASCSWVGALAAQVIPEATTPAPVPAASDEAAAAAAAAAPAGSETAPETTAAASAAVVPEDLADKPLPAVPIWAGDFALGFLATSGNTRSRSLNGKSKLIYAHEVWKNSFTASAINAHTVDGSATEYYTVENQTDWHFETRDYGFLALEWRTDLFATIRQHDSASVGLGRHLLLGPVHQLDVELGSGLRQELSNDEPRRRRTEAISRGAVHYLWSFSPHSSFAQELQVESGGHNTYVEAVSELKSAVVGNLYMGLSHTLKFNSQLADDARHTDTYTAFNLSYKFGTPP